MIIAIYFGLLTISWTRINCNRNSTMCGSNKCFLNYRAPQQLRRGQMALETMVMSNWAPDTCTLYK